MSVRRVAEEPARNGLRQTSRWVVKIGSALVTQSGRGLDHARMEAWASQIAALRAAGHEVVLVSSGAVAEGLVRLGLHRRPEAVPELQAAAAVGQMGLIQAWERAFARHGLPTALILLTHEDLSDRTRYLNARAAVRTLLRHGVVPVVNENDTVATDEIRFGDNDTLGALVTNLIEAEALVLLTDQAGLRERDPRLDPQAPRVAAAYASDPGLDAMAGTGAGHLGRGGMFTKLRAARMASRSGALTVIADGREAEVLQQVAAGHSIGTLLLPETERLAARKRWIAGQLQTRGTLLLDAGAVRALQHQGRSLLPVGVVAVRGQFARGDVVACLDPSGREVARGLVNYEATEARRLCGRSSAEMTALLGYGGEPEMVHRDNLVLEPSALTMESEAQPASSDGPH